MGSAQGLKRLGQCALAITEANVILELHQYKQEFPNMGSNPFHISCVSPTSSTVPNSGRHIFRKIQGSWNRFRAGERGSAKDWGKSLGAETEGVRSGRRREGLVE